jgi:SAM-dependent methyltransferase
MSELSESHDDVKLHYTVDDLGDRVLEALAASGVDLDGLTVDDLAPVDAFHIRGRESTEELARLARLRAEDRVLDAGCGIGGTSRYLAATHGCRVVGVDLTDDYINVARMLTGRVGLDGAVEFQVGSVLDLPFDDASFDVAWTEHAQMNIADKQSLYGELYRVLKPGGKLAFHDIFEGPEGDPHFPVPWAPDASISHLVRIEELRALLGAAGFSQSTWEDRTAASTAFFHAALERRPEGPGLHLVMEDPKTKLGNLLRNLEEGRVCVVQAVMRKPA